MATLAEIRTGMLGAFRARWDELRPTWDHDTQTAYPPDTYERDADQWIKVVCTRTGARNSAVGILDEVGNLLTVDCYNRFDVSTMFGVDAIADDAYSALRSMTLPSGVHLTADVDIRDFPLTATGFEQTRLAMFFRFDLDVESS